MITEEELKKLCNKYGLRLENSFSDFYDIFYDELDDVTQYYEFFRICRFNSAEIITWDYILDNSMNIKIVDNCGHSISFDEVENKLMKFKVLIKQARKIRREIMIEEL